MGPGPGPLGPGLGVPGIRYNVAVCIYLNNKTYFSLPLSISKCIYVKRDSTKSYDINARGTTLD